jgi:hypothetical protein
MKTKCARGVRRLIGSGGNQWIEALEPRRLLSVNVLTSHNDAARDGLNAAETLLSPANVKQASFGKLFSYPVTGQIYAQPLYVSNLTLPGQGTHNVVLVATEDNDVYAFDANSNAGPNGGLLWHKNLGPAAATPNNDFGNRYGPYHDINPQVGITSTPVIDLATNTMYVDAFTHDGSNLYSHHIHALDLGTGNDKVSPMLVAASVPGNGVGSSNGSISFVAEQQLQRPALSLVNGVLYAAYSGYADTDPYHGWILGFDATTLHLKTAFNDTPNFLSSTPSSTAGEGGIWQTGSGLASDGSSLFVFVGNGDFNASLGDYGDSALKLSTSGGLGVAGYFAPHNQQSLSDADEDLGSGGVMLLPDSAGSATHPHLMIGSGKQGLMYLIDRDNLGGYDPNTDHVVQEVSLGHGAFDSPAYFNGSIYYHASGDVLKAFSINQATLSTSPTSQSSTSYSLGATPSISANGTSNGIVWDLQFDSTHAVLHAYDATNVSKELYNSNQAGTRDQLGGGVKFAVPTIADGQAFVGTANAVTIFGLIGGPNLLSTGLGNGVTLSGTQRSEVRDVNLKFSHAVTLAAGAVTLGSYSGNDTTGALTDASAALGTPTTSDGGITWTLPIIANTAFSDPTGSLKDGIYKITVHSTLVTDSLNRGLSGGDQSTTFHRLYGDIDGNKTVNSADYFSFKAAFGSSTGQAGFNADFDFDGNGKINSSDYFKFKANFGRKFTY